MPQGRVVEIPDKPSTSSTTQQISFKSNSWRPDQARSHHHALSAHAAAENDCTRDLNYFAFTGRREQLKRNQSCSQMHTKPLRADIEAEPAETSTFRVFVPEKKKKRSITRVMTVISRELDVRIDNCRFMSPTRASCAALHVYWHPWGGPLFVLSAPTP